MEDLPAEYVEHGLPLVLLSGLTASNVLPSQTSGRQESGTRINAESNLCSVERATVISDQLQHWDGTSQPWNAVSLAGPTSALKFRFKSVGRNYTLPPRKAAPQAQSPTAEQVPIRQNNELHSPLSPLSPGSPVYPDGIMNSMWFNKHQSQVPCIVISFFDFTQGEGSRQDETIKADILAARGALTRSGFRTRFAAVLLSDKSIIQSSEMEERFSSIRRATSLDAKTGLFFMPPMPSAGEVATFLQTLLTTLQPGCVEYYRELTKHARRKKARSTIPLSPTLPIHGAAQSLSPPGWNARYELKQAVFAEARQEMDVAEHHYSQAIEDLCSADGVFESMPSWSPRWDETRLLCDSMATRIIRCHLWTGLTTTAAKFWYDYRARSKSLIDRKGKGTHTYGWLAWEARWARIMAQLIQLAELPMLDSVPRAKSEPPADVIDYIAYFRPDRQSQGYDNIPPVYLLHHSGYWHRLALSFVRARYASAISIPDEDRLPPGQSPASSVANRAQSYDTYLVPEPHEEYANADSLGLVEGMQIAQITEQAKQEFAVTGQPRFMQQLSMDLARDLLRSDHFEIAYEVLLPLWQHCTWRYERWHGLFNEVLTGLLQCATVARDSTTVLTIIWEQLALPPAEQDEDNVLEKSLQQLDHHQTTSLTITNDERLSPLQVQFAFDEVEAYASEQIKCQLILRNVARLDATPIHVKQLSITFSDGQEVTINSHGEDITIFEYIDLKNGSGSAPMMLSSSHTTVLQFDITFPESGSVHVQAITIEISDERFQIKHLIDDASLLQSPVIYSRQQESSYYTRREDTTHLIVHPKPPKIDVRLVDLRKQYFAGETINMSLKIVNQEAYSVSGDVTLSVMHSEDVVVPSQLSQVSSQGADDSTIEGLSPKELHSLNMTIESPQGAVQLALAIAFTYKLDGGAQSILIKTFETTIALAMLLEAKWAFGPLLHTQPWPSYFDPQALLSHAPSGIPQRWRASFAAALPAVEDITIHKSSLKLNRELEDANCKIESDVDDLSDNSKYVSSFELTTTKQMADDRRPIQLFLSCDVEWSRNEDSTVHTSAIPVPKITLPTSEPRVLCTVSQDSTGSADALLTYHLENPSTHFLTFAVTMDPSDDFAFGGVKYQNLSLVPMSRTAVSYKIVLHDSSNGTAGRWIWPGLQVVDSYYQKTLRVQPAGQNVKLDAEKGLAVFIKAR